jgi:hypothetical protein
MSAGFAPPTAALPTRVATRPERDLPPENCHENAADSCHKRSHQHRGVRMLSKASEIPRAVALVVATGYQNILDRRSTWIMANRHFGKIAESGSMPRWPRCWSESLQAGNEETT